LTEQQQREQLLVRVRQVAAEFKSRFRVKRVILFGSLVSSDWFFPELDVDLAGQLSG
jgi:predicted nucleotidyltransferase